MFGFQEILQGESKYMIEFFVVIWSIESLFWGSFCIAIFTELFYFALQ